KTLLVGVEGDFSWASKRGSKNESQTFLTSTFVGTSERQVATARARVGYLFQDQLLAYFTAGIALAQIDASFTDPTSGTVTDSGSFRAGFTVGAGVEYAIPNNSNWTIRIEYRFTDLFPQAYFSPPPLEGMNFRSNVPYFDHMIGIGATFKLF